MKNNFNVALETKKVIEWIQRYFEYQPSAKGAILGCSGGKDSNVVGKLLIEALGKNRVLLVKMPNGVQKDISDSNRVIEYLGAKSIEVNIEQAYNGIMDGVYKSIENKDIYLTRQGAINVPPRLRMTTLYLLGTSMNYRVCGTGNKSEAYVNFFTKYGDGGVDFNPIGDFDTEEVMAIGDYLGIPYDLVHKTPSDGLTGSSDEENLGFTYHQVNDYMDYGTSGDSETDVKIAWKHEQSLHKINSIPKYLKQGTIIERK